MRNVDELKPWIDLQKLSFYARYQVILVTYVGSKRY